MHNIHAKEHMMTSIHRDICLGLALIIVLDPLQELDPLQRYPLPKSDLLHVAYAMLFKCLFCGHSDEEQSAYLSLFMDIAQGR